MRPTYLILAGALATVLAADDSRHQLKLLNTLEGARPRVYSPIVFSADSKLLATCDYEPRENNSMVRLWDVDKRQVSATLQKHRRTVTAAAFSPDGKTLATNGRENDEISTVWLWDVPTGKEKGTLKGHTSAVTCLAFSPDGKTLVSGGGGERERGHEWGQIRLWDLATGKEKASLLGHKGAVLSVAFSADGKLIASSSGEMAASGLPTDGEVKVWDVAAGREVAPFKGKKEGEVRPVYSVAFSPDSKTVASADIFSNVLLWDARTGRRIKALQAYRQGLKETEINSATSVAFSPDGSTLAAATVQGIKLWDVQSGKEVGPVGGPSATVIWSVAFRPDGKVLASAGSKRVVGQINRLQGDETLNLWEWVPSK